MNAVPDDRHPNSPLVEVLFEIGFLAETSIECRRHEIQDLVRRDYPKLLLPTPEPGVAVALQPYKFETEDGLAGVMVSINRFAHYSRAYPGFEKFSGESQRLVKSFCDLFRLKKIIGIGLKHTNIIPFAREDGIAPVDNFLALGEAMQGVLPGKIENLSMRFVIPTGAGKMWLHIESIAKPDGSQEAFLLDLDYAKEGDLDAAKIEDYLNEAHEQSTKAFNQLITQTFHDYIRGIEV